MNNIRCTLCNSPAQHYCEDKFREYLQCMTCGLVFVPPKYFLSAQDEKIQYNFHENDPADIGYRKFLSRISIPMTEFLKAEAHGLDFGSGPGPTLSLMFDELGYKMEIYDPLYATDESVLDNQYDFITATEVVEHFHNPIQTLNKMWDCLKPGGYLGIMTKLVIDQTAFTSWHYKNDPTHVCFFSTKTFDWLTNHWQAKIVFKENDVIILHKIGSSRKCVHMLKTPITPL